MVVRAIAVVALVAEVDIRIAMLIAVSVRIVIGVLRCHLRDPAQKPVLSQKP